jgi:hypothetical protein
VKLILERGNWALECLSSFADIVQVCLEGKIAAPKGFVFIDVDLKGILCVRERDKLQIHGDGQEGSQF